MLTNRQVNNPSILQNYSPGCRLFVKHSIFSKIPFKKCQCCLNSVLCFYSRNIVCGPLTDRCIWKEGGGAVSIVKSPPLEAFRWRVYLCWWLCRILPRPLIWFGCSHCLHCPVGFQLCLHAQIQRLLVSKHSEDFYSHGIKGDWSLNSISGWFLTQSSHALQHNFLPNPLPNIL